MDLTICYFPIEHTWHVWDRDAKPYAQNTLKICHSRAEAQRFIAEQSGQDLLRIELVWNREFDWSVFGYASSLEKAIREAEDIRDSGDGARVKKVRIVNMETDQIVWPVYK